jgi:hypothetical protein
VKAAQRFIFDLWQPNELRQIADAICLEHEPLYLPILKGVPMAATFLDWKRLNKVTKKLIKALEPLSEEDREKVIAAVLALYGQK